MFVIVKKRYLRVLSQGRSLRPCQTSRLSVMLMVGGGELVWFEPSTVHVTSDPYTVEHGDRSTAITWLTLMFDRGLGV